MALDRIILEIKNDEGYRGEVYKCSEGFDTIGYGTRLPISKKEATLLLRSRLTDKEIELADKEPLFKRLPQEAQAVLLNMAYQMGVGGLLKFKRMWSALDERDFETASREMLDSRWAKQTPKRAKRLSERMRSIRMPSEVKPSFFELRDSRS